LRLPNAALEIALANSAAAPFDGDASDGDPNGIHAPTPIETGVGAPEVDAVFVADCDGTAPLGCAGCGGGGGGGGEFMAQSPRNRRDANGRERAM
jgi:hypothetical protein